MAELEQLRTHPDPAIRETAQVALAEATWDDDWEELGDL